MVIWVWQGTLFLWVEFTDYKCVGDVQMVIRRDVMKVYGCECICTNDTFGGYASGILSNALTETTQFVSKGGILGVLICSVGA